MVKFSCKYVEILRPMNCLLVSVTVLIGFLVTLGFSGFLNFINYPLNIIKLLLAFFTYFLIVGSGNTINDVIDYKIDQINRPARPIVRGALTQKKATFYYIYLIILIGLLSIVGASLSPNPSIIPFFVIFFLCVSFTYSLKVKVHGLVANFTVGFAASLGFPFASLFLVDFMEIWYLKDIWVFYSVSFFLLFIHEIVKDVEDIDGDSLHGVKSVILKYGQRTTLTILGLLLTFLIGIFAYSMIYYNFNLFFIMFICLTLISLATGFWAVTNDLKEKKWGIFASKCFRVAEVSTIIAYLLAIVF